MVAPSHWLNSERMRSCLVVGRASERGCEVDGDFRLVEIRDAEAVSRLGFGAEFVRNAALHTPSVVSVAESNTRPSAGVPLGAMPGSTHSHVWRQTRPATAKFAACHSPYQESCDCAQLGLANITTAPNKHTLFLQTMVVP